MNREEFARRFDTPEGAADTVADVMTCMVELNLHLLDLLLAKDVITIDEVDATYEAAASDEKYEELMRFIMAGVRDGMRDEMTRIVRTARTARARQSRLRER